MKLVAATLCSVVLLIMLTPMLASARTTSSTNLADSRQRLSALAERLKQAEDAFLKNQADVSQIGRELGKLQHERERIARRITTLRRQGKKIQGEAVTLRREIKTLQALDHDRSILLKKRLIAMHKTARSGALPILFGTGDSKNSYEDYLYFRRIAENDQRLLTETRQRRQRLETQIVRLEKLRQNQQDNQAALSAEQRELKTARKLKQRVLKWLKGQGGDLARSLTALRQQQERLRALVKKLESSQSAKYTQVADDFDRQRGRLRAPVKASVKIGFGLHQRPADGVLVDSHGLEFAVSSGDAVQSIWAGRVVFADSFRGFGQLIIVDHGEGYYSLYAHAEQLLKSAGDQIVTGEQLAVTGERCYFEIRHNGAPIDPKPWLRPLR